MRISERRGSLVHQLGTLSLVPPELVPPPVVPPPVVSPPVVPPPVELPPVDPPPEPVDPPLPPVLVPPELLPPVDPPLALLFTPPLLGLVRPTPGAVVPPGWIADGTVGVTGAGAVRGAGTSRGAIAGMLKVTPSISPQLSVRARNPPPNLR